MSKQYDPSAVEPKWQGRWEEARLYEVDLKKAKKPYYTHVMFPYPSGDKLHVGHWYNFGPADSYARLKRMQGYDVFSPMGFDAFGLPAENYAIKTGIPPRKSTEDNVATMIRQLKRIGCMYDWNRAVNTSHPEYYKWTQWLFLQMHKNGLAYRKEAEVNFCPECQTVLANEQVWDGKCERCERDVVQKPMEQWYWKITDYTQRLLDGLKDLEWPEKTNLMQRNWIGRSEGCDVTWKVDGHDITLDTFTTTVDTIYGVTFAVISPEHPALPDLISGDQRERVESYVEAAKSKTELVRMMEKGKTGVFMGTYLIHPFTGDKIPLWVADYVLMSYGTGVVMGVPAHDQRDMDFAKKYKLPIVQSIQSADGESFVYDDVDKYSVEGTIIDSGEFTGVPIFEGRKKIIKTLEKKKLGKGKVEYRIRDWCISRQRYWGSPIPIVYDPEGKPHPVPEEYLPWLLPDDVEFKPTGTAPLAQSNELKERTEKIFGSKWTPEVDTMDTFVCSSFYSFMYLSASHEGGRYTQLPINGGKIVDAAIEKKWMPVAMYIGGAEHACMHLIYARFVTMALKDFGCVKTSEPYKKLVHQGVITNGGAKMSKSKGNVVSPDEFIERYGSDVFRMYLMFMGPYSEGGDWSDTGIKGIDRFVQRVWKALSTKVQGPRSKVQGPIESKLHATIKKVTEDIEALRFNTAISALMELLNELETLEKFPIEVAQTFAKLLAPLAPHLADELWETLDGKGFVVDQPWPSYDSQLLVTDTVTIAIQVNGKVRGQVEVKAGASEKEVLAAAKTQDNVKRHIEGKDLKKEMYVEGKLVSLVV